MKIKHLLEGAEPKLPGAVSGIQIMTPQQFVAKSAEGEEPGSEEGVSEASPQATFNALKGLKSWQVVIRNNYYNGKYTDYSGRYYYVLATSPEEAEQVVLDNADAILQDLLTKKTLTGKKILPRSKAVRITADRIGEIKDGTEAGRMSTMGFKKMFSPQGPMMVKLNNGAVADVQGQEQGVMEGSDELYGLRVGDTVKAVINGKRVQGDVIDIFPDSMEVELLLRGPNSGKTVTVDVRDTEALNEATKLPASTRELKGQELEDYLDRIRNREKTKQDKYKMPYIHRSSVMGYYNEEGKKYDTDAIKNALKERPKKLLKQNEKMKHSNGELEQFFNIGFAALTGIALDENTNELIIVNTCPGAGSCKVDCFAMKGGKIQFQGPWLSDGRILTYLLNDPDGFFKQLDSEIKKEETKGDKGGYTVTIRWHDAGDFFSPEYVDLAFKLAKANPDVMFYAYTKMGDVVLAEKPANFMINWSEGAHTSQEKKVKAADTNLEQTKNSRIVPSNLFYDLLVKDEKKNLVKGPEGQWQVIPAKLPELKQRLAKEYGLSPNSILSYDEWATKGKRIPNMKWNVIITPGEPDITARDPGVLSTLLLKH